MSTTHSITLGGVHVRGAWNSPGGDVRAELAVYTRTGQARIAQLNDAQLIQLIADAAEALRQLRTHAEVTRRHRPVERGDTSARAMLDER